MTQTLVLQLSRQALFEALALAGPLLAVALIVGLIVSIIQAVTSIQEQTLSFVPKLFAVGATFLFLLSWMLDRMIRYTAALLQSIPGIAS